MNRVNNISRNYAKHMQAPLQLAVRTVENDTIGHFEWLEWCRNVDHHEQNTPFAVMHTQFARSFPAENWFQ